MIEILMTANVLVLVINSFYLGMKWERHRAAAQEPPGEPSRKEQK